jgi:hypothetical protein
MGQRVSEERSKVSRCNRFLQVVKSMRSGGDTPLREGRHDLAEWPKSSAISLSPPGFSTAFFTTPSSSKLRDSRQSPRYRAA